MTLPVEQTGNGSQLKSMVALKQTETASFIIYIHPKGVSETFLHGDCEWEKADGEETDRHLTSLTVFFLNLLYP